MERVIFRCGLAIALVAAALGFTTLLQSAVSTAGFLFFYAAILASAWFGGKWAGWLAVALSTLTVEYFFTSPVFSFGVDRNSLPLFLEFAVSSAIVSWFSSWRKRAEAALKDARDGLQLRVEERTAELSQANRQLLAEMAERARAEEAYNQAQAELARVTRISAMGALAASISHEVNQPLAAVVTNADACAIWLASEPANLEEARAAVESIVQEGTRASDIVRRIRAMFTKGALERTPLDINITIREAAGLLESQLAKQQVSLRLELADDLPLTSGDPIQLQQVIVNLMLNGMEAMRTVDRPRVLTVRSAALEPDEIAVAVEDRGAGFDRKDEKSLFHAFFTTKEQGMGMGLAICNSIVESHGGRLRASNNSDFGATFQFTLPRSA